MGRTQTGIHLLCATYLCATSFGVACGHPGARTPDSDENEASIIVSEDYASASESSQSAWVVYALGRLSTWQELEGEARGRSADDYEIELGGRRRMLEFWNESGYQGQDPTIDLLAEIDELGFLEEYVIAAFARPGWTIPGPDVGRLDSAAFLAWAQQNLRDHVGRTLAQTRPDGVPQYVPIPGGSLPATEEFFTQGGVPRCDRYPEIESAMKKWTKEKRELAGEALAAPNGVTLLYLLQEPTARDRSRARGVTMVPEELPIYATLAGFCAIEAREWNDAREYLKEAISLAPNNMIARMELAHVYIQVKDFEPALEQVEIAIEGSEDPCEIARALRKKGFIEFDLGKLAHAYETYMKSLDYEPDSDLARSEMSLIYRQMEDRGWPDLPLEDYQPPASGQLTTRCTTGTAPPPQAVPDSNRAQAL